MLGTRFAGTVVLIAAAPFTMGSISAVSRPASYYLDSGATSISGHVSLEVSYSFVNCGAQDCDGNGVGDLCDIASGFLADANGDGVPDVCQIPHEDFVRGDSNFDGSVNLADAIATWNFLIGSAPSPCLEAVDADADGHLNLSDPIYTIYYAFAAGTAPVLPFPDCGQGQSFGYLGCETFSTCP